MTRVLICGGRDYGVGKPDEWRAMLAVLQGMRDRVWPSVIIEGGAPGADAGARAFAQLHDIAVETYAADWRAHGKAAGPIRNQRMIDEGKPDLVIAFPGGRGTADMVRRARAAGLPVEEFGFLP